VRPPFHFIYENIVRHFPRLLPKGGAP